MRRYWWVVAAGVAMVGLVLTVVWWPRGRELPPARARVYTNAKACLLTDSSGILGQQAAATWAGMESASVRTRTMVSYLAVSGDDSVANAVPFLNTLVQRGCGLIIAVGPSQVGAVGQRASSYPKVRFATVGSGSGKDVTLISADSPETVSGVAEHLVATITER